MGWHVAYDMHTPHRQTSSGPGCRYNEGVARVLVAVVQTADDLIDEYAKFQGPQPRPVPGATRDAELVAGIPYMLRSRCVHSVPDERVTWALEREASLATPRPPQ